MSRFIISHPRSSDQLPSSPVRHQNAVMNHFVHSSRSYLCCQATQRRCERFCWFFTKLWRSMCSSSSELDWLLIGHHQPPRYTVGCEGRVWFIFWAALGQRWPAGRSSGCLCKFGEVLQLLFEGLAAQILQMMIDLLMKGRGYSVCGNGSIVIIVIDLWASEYTSWNVQNQASSFISCFREFCNAVLL